MEEEMERPGVEFQIAVVGPAMSLLMAFVAFLLGEPLRGSGSPTEAVLDYLVVSNVLLGVFNLLPGFPLDGGRVLRSLIWKVTGNVRQATRIASYVGQGFAYAFLLLGIVGFFTGNVLGGLWTVFIGWFLLNAAQTTRRQVVLQDALQGISVERVMNPRPVTVPANISLHKLVNEYFLRQGIQAVPVVQGEYLVGLITLSDIARVEPERWSYTPVGHVMRLPEQIALASPEQPLHDLLEVMVTRGITEIPVVQEERLVGLVSREAIPRYLLLGQPLQVDERADAA
jgi:CBS domain-containing protein